MKKSVLITISLIVLTLCWYLTADRWTPYTSNGVVKAIVTPLVSEVSGTLTHLPVDNGTIVNPGDLLARIDRRTYEIAREIAHADLKQALQDVGAQSASIGAAQANVSAAEANLDNVRVQSARILKLERVDAVSKAEADDARTELSEAESALDEAKAELENARQQLGPKGNDNPRVQHAMAQLAKAELDLHRTEIHAPAKGGITNLVVAPGAYVAAGTPLLTFVDIGQIWVEAYLTENNLGNLHVGAPAEIALDIHPGKIFKGRVTSLYAAVSDETDSKPGTLSSAPRKSGWLRSPQRIPVRIMLEGLEIGNPEDNVRFQINGQADVIVYSGNNPLLKLMGKLLIRFNSILSYAY